MSVPSCRADGSLERRLLAVVLAAATSCVPADFSFTTGSGGSGDGAGGGTTVSSSQSGTGGATPDHNDTLETAQPMQADQAAGTRSANGSLSPPETDVDCYLFSGLAGPVAVVVEAKPSIDEFAPQYADVIVRLYDANKMLIARNDEPFPARSQDPLLFTVLPDAGIYYLKVEEHCSFAGTDQHCDENYFEALTLTGYQIAVVELTEELGIIAAMEPDDDEPNATDASVDMPPGGSIVRGDFAESGPATPDAIAFGAPPLFEVDPPMRPTASFFAPPAGVTGSGSSNNPGLMTITDLVTDEVIARFDMSDETDLSRRAALTFPIVPGRDYLFIQQPGPVVHTPLDPFYFIVHQVGSGFPVEVEPNDDDGLAQELDDFLGVGVSIEGDLPDLPVPDVADCFRLLTTNDRMAVTCDSRRAGSGAIDFEVTVYSADDMTEIANAMEDVDPSKAIRIENVDTTDVSEVIVRLEKGGQDPVVVSNYYSCHFEFYPAP